MNRLLPNRPVILIDCFAGHLIQPFAKDLVQPFAGTLPAQEVQQEEHDDNEASEEPFQDHGRQNTRIAGTAKNISGSRE
jgi:hypothetical protein